MKVKKEKVKKEPRVDGSTGWTRDAVLGLLPAGWDANQLDDCSTRWTILDPDGRPFVSERRCKRGIMRRPALRVNPRATSIVFAHQTAQAGE